MAEIGTKDHASQVDVDLIVEITAPLFGEPAVPRDPRGVDQDIQPTAAGFHERIEGTFPFVFLAHVVHDREAGVVSANRGQGCLQTRSINVRKSDQPALCRKALGGCEPDPAGGTGDEDGFAFGRHDGLRVWVGTTLDPNPRGITS